MSLSEDKVKVVTNTYEEIGKIHDKLKEIMKEINSIGLSLQNKYKMVASIVNEPYSSSTFVKETDFTSNTLYYCLDPLLDGLGVFFIPSKDGSKLLPIQAAVVTSNNSEPGLDVTFNPAFSEAALASKGLEYMDILIKFSDLFPPIQNVPTDTLKRLFDSPPEATGEGSEYFDNIIMQKLFEITKNPEFKNTILKPKSKLIKA